MKHILTTILTTLAACLIIIPFTACTNEEGEDIPGNQTADVKSHIITYTITHTTSSKNSDITNIADVTIHCVDHNNAETTKVLTNGTAEIKIDVKDYPCAYTFYTTITLKPGVAIDNESKYDVALSIAAKSTKTYTNGTTSISAGASNVKSEGIEGTDIAEYCNHDRGNKTFAFDADGNLIE